ncbi:MAG: T9SS type A sorting domain-containing protein [Candidatus Eisenbacteria bacterium]|nr:T9SS type A sorting domain-containing protein [Candidatus Eisenbacteria bacterium]
MDGQGNVVSSGATATSDPEHSLYVNPDPGTYQWKVVSFDNPNPNEAYTVTSIRCVAQPVGVGDRGPALAFRLDPNEPNPFTRSSVLRFALPVGGRVSLAIYDIAGRRVRTLVDGTLDAGWHQRVWDGTGDDGVRAGAGVYFSRLEGPQGVRSRKMIMLR